MSWLKVLENAFGTKDRDKKKYKDGKHKPGRFEVDLRKKGKRSVYLKKLEDSKNKMNKEYAQTTDSDQKAVLATNVSAVDANIAGELQRYEEDPTRYIRDSIVRSRDNYIQNSTKENDMTTAEWPIEELVKRRYLNPDPEIRAKQWEDLKLWFQYFKRLPDMEENMNFIYFVLRSVLEYDLNWLDTDEAGTFKYKQRERTKTNRSHFPIFEPDLTPEILARMREFMAINEFSGFERLSDAVRGALPEYAASSPLNRAMLNGDFRTMYNIFRERVKLGRIDRRQIIEKVSEGWLPPVTYEGVKESDRAKVAQRVSDLTVSSHGFCIKSPTTANDYLRRGDLYFYMVKYKVDRNKGKKDAEGNVLPPDIIEVEIPEIAIHIEKISGLSHQKDGEIMYRINPHEVHGDGPKQGILPEFMPIARKWIEDSNFENKDAFIVKFADAEMLSVVKKKIENLPDGEDLNTRELRFLYEIYRLVTTFQVDSVSNDEVDRLKELRFEKITRRGDVPLNIEGRIARMDIAKMFGVEPDEVFFAHSSSDIYHISEKTKVLVVHRIGQRDLDETARAYKEMFEQGRTIGVKTVVGKIHTDELNFFPNLEEVTDRIMLVHNVPVKKVPKRLARVKGFEFKKGGVLRELKKAEKAKKGTSWPNAFDVNRLQY
jgi:hypothetical protein